MVSVSEIMLSIFPIIIISSTIPLGEEIIMLDKNYGEEAYEYYSHETLEYNSDGFIKEWVDRFSPRTTIDCDLKE